MNIMGFTNIFLLITILFVLSEATSLTSYKASSPCGDWIPFKDAKCFKISINARYQTQEDAEVVCMSFSKEFHRESYPKLIAIRTKEEQDFLQQLLFTDNRIKDPVWLGLKDVNSTGEFQWNDGSKPPFTNWANQTVSGDQHRCVVMDSGGGIAPIGSWVKVDCEKANRVVCERTPTFTLEMFQNLLSNVKLEGKKKDEKRQKEFDDLKRNANSLKQETISLKQETVSLNQETISRKQETISLMQETISLKQETISWKVETNSLKEESNSLKQEITKIKNSVPIGFIYAQLPDQDAPTTLWPGTNWTDVSSNYAGLFFRVVGGNAAPFGQVQDGNSSRLEQISVSSKKNTNNPLTIPPDGSWSEFIYSGSNCGSDATYLKFRLSKEEVRPRNQAMKLWQRIK